MFLPQKKKKRQLCDRTEVLAKATVRITLQYINAQIQYAIHLKPIQRYMLIIY